MKQVIKEAFWNQRDNAKKRGIAFVFIFEDWCQWWEEQLGTNWFELRGCKKDQYVMARKDDLGAYSWGNVKCITSSQNHLERNKRLWIKRSKRRNQDDPTWFLR